MPNPLRTIDAAEHPSRVGLRGWVERGCAISVCAIGLWLSLEAWLPVYLDHSTAYAEPVRAQVVESRFQGRSDSDWRLGPGQPVFAYRYVHRGRIFHASGYRPGGGLVEAVRRFPPGTMVTAYLDPARPQAAMLFPGVHGDQIARGLVGLCLLLSGMLFVQRLWPGPDPSASSPPSSAAPRWRSVLTKEPRS
ncbi:DUF3592 domain-containing protein [Wenzhouxiangella marina]|uniref:DUF3592 domain-containing protein n=1 Tax=Wenzhouxiangella marina TaxID=1579979 RepID=A0A0K0XU63_9GAMM|nr:DUF3592 domain-containing protein [Wenzhouxiangella marina]AKS41213.1 hypothetical protein WM2015_832 [Wenzhouxiangella marina]MBB6088093.1 hypothetical protein [Wenzhouxiangella marina]